MNLEKQSTKPGLRPAASGSGDNNLAPLDLQTPAVFENGYYKNLVGKRGLLHSDQELFNGGAADALVREYAGSQGAFFKDFVEGMIKMGDIKPLYRVQRTDQEELQED